MRKTIYVANEDVWNDVKRRASEMSLSVSQYLLGQPIKEVPTSDQLDRIEAMLDRLVPEKRGTPIYGNGVSSTKITLEDHGLSDPKVFEKEGNDDI